MSDLWKLTEINRWPPEQIWKLMKIKEITETYKKQYETHKKVDEPWRTPTKQLCKSIKYNRTSVRNIYESLRISMNIYEHWWTHRKIDENRWTSVNNLWKIFKNNRTPLENLRKFMNIDEQSLKLIEHQRNQLKNHKYAWTNYENHGATQRIFQKLMKPPGKPLSLSGFNRCLPSRSIFQYWFPLMFLSRSQRNNFP